MKDFDVAVEAISVAAFSPYGEIIDARPEEPVFRGAGLRSWRLPFEAIGTTELMVIEYEEMPLNFTKLERHTRVGQAYVPLTARAMVMAVALGNGAQPPALADVRAFYVPAHQGILLKAQTWHGLNRFPLGGAARYAFLTTAETQAELEAQRADGTPPRLTEVHDFAAEGRRVTLTLPPTLALAQEDESAPVRTVPHGETGE